MYKPKPRWTKNQEIFLTENFYKLKDEELAQILGRSLKAVRRKREEMTLAKLNGRGLVGKREIQFEEEKSTDI